jgi:hypothetical protein
VCVSSRRLRGLEAGRRYLVRQEPAREAASRRVRTASE